MKQNDTFIFRYWMIILRFLKKLSIFSLLRKYCPFAKSHFFVDIWIVFHSILALECFLITCAIGGWLAYTIVLYGVLRVFEMVVYQLNVLLFDEYQKRLEHRKYRVKNYRRLFIILLHNYFEVIFWYASIYFLFSKHFSLISDKLYLFILESARLLFTFSSGTVVPNDAIGFVIVLSQIAIGLFLTLMILARAINLLPSVKSMDKYENNKSTIIRKSAASKITHHQFYHKNRAL